MSLTDIRTHYLIKDGLPYTAIKSFNRKMYDNLRTGQSYDSFLKERYADFSHDYVKEHKKMPSRGIKDHMTKYMLETDFRPVIHYFSGMSDKSLPKGGLISEQMHVPLIGLAEEPQQKGGSILAQGGSILAPQQEMLGAGKRKPGRPKKGGMYNLAEYGDDKRSFTGAGKISLK